MLSRRIKLKVTVIYEGTKRTRNYVLKKAKTFKKPKEQHSNPGKYVFFQLFRPIIFLIIF